MEAFQRSNLTGEIEIRCCRYQRGGRICGIIGFVGQVPEGMWGQTHNLLKGLYRSSLHRGTDATGFVARTSPLDDPLSGETVVAKAPLPADEFMESCIAF